MKTSLKRGFTLIELLVVIAIIGVLSSVVLASLSTARIKGRTAAAQSNMKAVQTAASMCLNEAVAINTTVTTPGTTLVCAGSATAYPVLPAGWTYGTITQTTGSVFSIPATGDGKTVTCSEASCVTI
ncbi:hypothetical protein A3C86_00640 [Candidatus Kaiserbacteria bacterium RIFCSPHIGHO2_02_FULL_49_16]|uniref:Type II secretion system protein GspG C-terminal domain-containing protein n=1 Tax=Candidatus Kaiserbacteria bacterium RIFCSPHIGHO2_02_FULL_49_16 TaxID=1798490 RepID=A0A1F6DDE8_9BACT|nr:MAG: hypothetical protein A3C86_00640 [Candidatus Kaiserbacteria bacterium RIFCSPHIGHO2_02_FULL_49_16]